MNFIYPLIEWIVLYAVILIPLLIMLNRVVKRQRDNAQRLEQAINRIDTQLARIADILDRRS